MDNNSVATLQDYQSAIERNFKTIEKEFKEFNGADASRQNLALGSLTTNQSTVKTNIGLMRMELSNLKDDNNIKKWQEIIEKLQAKNEEYKKRILELKNKKEKNNNDDSIDINNDNIDVKKLTSKQAMNYGDKILEDDNQRIKNMKKIVGEDIGTMKEVNKELERQNEVLDNAEKDLKDIDYSLKRAGQQIKTMFKMYATDKLIMCMIVVIVLVIIAIIIASIVGKNKDNSNQNLPHDIFSNKKNTTTRKLMFFMDFN